jgi:hypothetical protein
MRWYKKRWIIEIKIRIDEWMFIFGCIKKVIKVYIKW